MENIKEQIKNLEEKINARLPQDYKEFLLDLEQDFVSFPKYKGWENIHEYKVEYLHRERPLPAYHAFHSSDPDCKWPILKIINLYSLIEQEPYNLITAYDNFQVDKGKDYGDFLSIADNGCGDEVCVALKGRNRGKVYICAHEQNYKLIVLSNSLKEFFSQMKKE